MEFLGMLNSKTLLLIIDLYALSLNFIRDRWAELDVDPAMFSRELIDNASSMVEDTEVHNFNFQKYSLV